MRVPLIKPDLPQLSEVADRFGEILSNGRISNFGKYVTEFERASGEYLGAEAVTVSSGSMGLLFALQAFELPAAARRVVVPSFTFMATVQAIQYADCHPLLADIDDSMTLCPDDLARLLEDHQDVGAVFAIHTYGLPAKVDELQRLVDAYAKKHGRHVPLLFDAAHAFGSAVGSRKVGSLGDAEVFSLSVTKVLVSIEGGLITSRRPEIIRRIKKMRNYGIEANYETWYPGLNGKMSEFHAIVGLANLARLDERLESRGAKAATYRDLVESRTPCRFVPLPEGVTHTWKDVTVMLPRGTGEKRAAIMAALEEDGVETRPYFYPAVHQQAYFRHLDTRPLPVTEDLATRCITLPNYTGITDEEMGYVADRLAAACERSNL